MCVRVCVCVCARARVCVCVCELIRLKYSRIRAINNVQQKPMLDNY